MESLLASAVEKGDFELVRVMSGEEALRQVLTQEFAVILLDANMPDMDGFETAAAIHSHPRSASVPIIFTTAYYGDEVYRLRAYQHGAVDYLVTPVIPQMLQTKVAVFVELAKKRLELQRKTRALEALNNDLRAKQLLELQRINFALETEIVERRLAEQRAHELATRDALTRLPNRRSLIERLEHAVSYASRHHERLALLFLDLDKFKPINDTLGHAAGDELLIQVAARIASHIRETDMAARLGGDEFVVLLEGLSDTADARMVAVKIVQALEQPYDIGSHRVSISASVGISLYPEHGDSMQALMSNADSAMYYAKRHAHGRIWFFQQRSDAGLSKEMNN